MVWDKTLSITSSSLDFWLTCRYRGNIHSVGPLSGSWLAACMADLTPDLKVYLSWGSIAKSFHSLQSLSVSSSMSSWASQGHAFHQPVRLDCPLEQVTHWIWWWQIDNVLRLDIADLSDHCPVVSLQMLEVWLCQWPSLTGRKHCVHTHELYTRPRVLKERWQEERTGSSSLNFFQAFITSRILHLE